MDMVINRKDYKFNYCSVISVETGLNAIDFNKRCNIRYNIKKLSQNRFSIVIDVAGFYHDELSIKNPDGSILIKSNPIIYKKVGIETIYSEFEKKPFKVMFTYNKDLCIEDSFLEYGLLTILIHTVN